MIRFRPRVTLAEVPGSTGRRAVRQEPFVQRKRLSGPRHFGRDDHDLVATP